MRALLILLLGFAGLTAVIFGFEMILFPDGSTLDLPLSLLQHTPFSGFFVPGIILAFVVGGFNLSAVFCQLTARRNRYEWSFWAGLILCGWIVVQMLLIREVNGLQLVCIAWGIAIMAVTRIQRVKFLH